MTYVQTETETETLKRILGVPETTAQLLTIQPTVRTVARRDGINLSSLIDILSWRRPDQSEEEADFVEQFLDPIEGMTKDDFGNRYFQIGEDPIVMWSCHTDTVSDDGGKQNVKWDGDTLRLNEPRRGQTLGADDGAGLWLMLEMIKANRPGLYIFHRAEEVGGLGSKHIASKLPDVVKNIKMAIAFDRKATHSVITYQRGERCCSDAFAVDLADRLNQTPGLAYKLDDGGVFTDTASYTRLIPECTNLSAGYYNEHTETESLDVAHLLRLRTALLTLDVTDLPIERDPTKVESKWAGYGYGYGYGYGNLGRSVGGDQRRFDNILQFVKNNPHGLSKWFQKSGYTTSMLEDLVWEKPSKPSYTPSAAESARVFLEGEELELVEDQVVEEVEGLECNECNRVVTEEELFIAPYDRMECPWCESDNTNVVSLYVDDQGEVIEYA